MASIATHYIFSEDVSIHLPAQIHELIRQHSGAYHMGAQGPDLFFYDLPHLAITSKQHNIGTIMHERKTDSFLAHMLEEIAVLSREETDGGNTDALHSALAYFYGMLTHYCLDSTIHPYVYSRTTFPDTATNAKSRSLAAHCQLESDIDEILYQEHTGETINNHRRSDFIAITKKQAAAVAPVLANAINKTYGCRLSASYLRGTIARAKWTNSRLQDNNGWKKVHLTNLEHKLTGSSVGTSLIFHTTLPSRLCMNEDHQIWRIPATGKLRTDSVYELFDQALIRATKLITHADQAFHELSTMKHESDAAASLKTLRRFAHETGGLSYHTGINWRL